MTDGERAALTYLVREGGAGADEVRVQTEAQPGDLANLGAMGFAECEEGWFWTATHAGEQFMREPR